MNTNLQAGLREAKEQLAGSDRRLKEVSSAEARARAELARLQKENEELHKKDEGLRKENEELRNENRDVRATLTARESRLVELVGQAAGNQTKLDHTAKLLEAAEGKKKTAETWATAAEGRASAAEERGSILQKELSTTRGELSTARVELSTTRDELSAAQGESSAAREELSTARAELTRALEAAVQAVETYKKSKGFEVDAALACVDLYKIGYTDCLQKVREGHPTLDLSQLAREVEDEEEEGEEEEEEEAIEGGAETTLEMGPADEHSAPGEGGPAVLLLTAGVPAAGTSQTDKGPKEGGPLAGTSKSLDSGNDASEPIIVESPEPERNQQSPVKKL